MKTIKAFSKENIRDAELRIKVSVGDSEEIEEGVMVQTTISTEIWADGEELSVKRPKSAKEYLDLGPIINLLVKLGEDLHSERGTSFSAAVEDVTNDALKARDYALLEGLLEEFNTAALEDAEVGGSA